MYTGLRTEKIATDTADWKLFLSFPIWNKAFWACLYPPTQRMILFLFFVVNESDWIKKKIAKVPGNIKAYEPLTASLDLSLGTVYFYSTGKWVKKIKTLFPRVYEEESSVLVLSPVFSSPLPHPQVYERRWEENWQDSLVLLPLCLTSVPLTEVLGQCRYIHWPFLGSAL